MKRFTTYISMIALIFSLGLNTSLAASGGGGGGGGEIQAPECTVSNTCVVYVNDNGPGDNGTKSNPYYLFTDAVNYVKGNADYNTIRIAGGSYSQNETFPIEIMNTGKAIYIQGGYSEDFNTLDPSSYESIFDANSSIFIQITDNAGSVRGITIEDTEGGAIIINNSGATSYHVDIEDNVFQSNQKNGGSIGSTAVDVLLEGSNSALLNNNTFTNNAAEDTNIITRLNGGSNDTLIVTNNVYHSNGGHGAILCEDALLYNNYFLDNTMGVLVKANGDCEVYHNTFAHNGSLAAIVAFNNTNKIINNLVTHTAFEDYQSYSIYQEPTETSIVDGNAFFANAEDPELTGSNRVCDPMYPASSGTDPDDVKLGADSSCIDKALSISDAVKDYYGNIRPMNGDGFSNPIRDPGAYEVPDLNLAAPVITNLAVSFATFSPNNDGHQDETTISFKTSEKAQVSIIFEYNNMKQSLLDGSIVPAGSISENWDGTYDVSLPVDDGTYEFSISASNVGGNSEETIDVTIDRTMTAPVTETPTTETTTETTTTTTETESSINENNTPDEIADAEEEMATQAKADTGGTKCGSFTDVAASHPDCEALEFVKSKGAMTGNPDGTFAPAEALQRDQIAKITLEAFGMFDENEDYCNGSNPFPDVTSSAWSYQYICRAVDLGLVTGYKSGPDTGKYVPGRSVNRVEALAILLRSISNLPEITNSSYDDVASGQWFSGYAKFAQDNGLFLGSKLYSSDTTIRLEVADIIFKLNKLGKLSS